MSVGLVLTAFFAWSPLLALHLRELGANDLQVGIAFSIFTLAHYLPALLGGVLADRFGRKWVFTAPGLVLTPLYLLGGLTRDWVILTVLLTLTNFVGAMQWPAMQAFLSESDEDHRATAFSFLEIFVLGAAIVGPLVSSALLPVLGVAGLIFAHGIALLPATAARAFLLNETHHHSQGTTFDVRQWRTAFPSAILWIVAANALFALALGLSFEGPFSALLANDVWKLTQVQIQWVNSAGAAVALLGVWLGGKADVWGGRRIWVLSALGFAGTLVGWGLSPRWEIGLVFFLGAHVFYETIFIVAETMLAHHSTRATRSSVFGFLTTVAGFSTAAGPTLGAWAAALTSLAAPFLLGAISLVASLGLLRQVSDAKPKPGDEVVPEEFVARQVQAE
jgi:MFS family permease